MMEKCEGLLRFISKSKENKFSESDLEQGIEMARLGWFSKTSENTTDKEWEFNETEIIKALKKNKPTIIEIEIEKETKIPLSYQKDGKIYLKLK